MDDRNEYSYQALEEGTEVPQGLAPASRGRRLAASLIDAAIASAITFPLVFLIYGQWSIPNSSLGTKTGWDLFLQSTSLLTPDNFGLTFLSTGLMLALQSWFIFTRSQTIGKMALGISIYVHGAQNRASYRQIVLKRMLLIDAMTYVPVLGVVFALVDVLFIFGTTRRCLHDRIAGTWVVRI